MFTKIIMRFNGLLFVTFIFLLSSNLVKSQEKKEISDTILVTQTQMDELLLLFSDSGNVEVVKYLLDNGANPNVSFIDIDSFIKLKYSNGVGNFQYDDLILRKLEGDVNALQDGNTLLHNAVLLGNENIVKLLIDYKANVNKANNNGITPLHLAAWNGLTKIIYILIENGADPNIRFYDSNTLLHYESMNGNDSIAELLLKHNADANIQNKLGLTPLHYSAWYGMPYLTDLLLYYGAKVNIHDNNGFTPLMFSTYSGAFLSAKVLLENNADPNIVNKKGVSALMLAAQFNDTAFIGLLYDYGADIDLVDNNGANALVYAINSNSDDAIEFLVSLGAAQRKLNKSYYQLAAETDYIKLRYKLDSLGLKTKLRPLFSNLFVNSGLIFSKHEFLWGFNIGITEQVSKLNVSLGYWYRPMPIATLEYRGMDIYQFREKRQIIELKAIRLMPVKIFRNNSFGFYYGGNIDVVFRNFRGTENDPKTSVYPGINAGFYWGSKSAKVFSGWEFTSLKTPDVSQHRIGVTINFYIPLNKSTFTKTYINYVD